MKNTMTEERYKQIENYIREHSLVEHSFVEKNGYTECTRCGFNYIMAGITDEDFNANAEMIFCNLGNKLLPFSWREWWDFKDMRRKKEEQKGRSLISNFNQKNMSLSNLFVSKDLDILQKEGYVEFREGEVVMTDKLEQLLLGMIFEEKKDEIMEKIKEERKDIVVEKENNRIHIEIDNKA